MLTGDEVKSLRGGRASLTEAYARVRDGEVWLEGMHVPPTSRATSGGTCRPARASCCCIAARSRSWRPSSRSSAWRSCRCACTSPTAWRRSSSAWREASGSTRSASRSRSVSRSARSLRSSAAGGERPIGPGPRIAGRGYHRVMTEPTAPRLDEIDPVIALLAKEGADVPRRSSTTCRSATPRSSRSPRPSTRRYPSGARAPNRPSGSCSVASTARCRPRGLAGSTSSPEGRRPPRSAPTGSRPCSIRTRARGWPRPSAAQLELVALRWLRELFGLPPTWGGRAHDRRHDGELHRAWPAPAAGGGCGTASTSTSTAPRGCPRCRCSGRGTCMRAT